MSPACQVRDGLRTFYLEVNNLDKTSNMLVTNFLPYSLECPSGQVISVESANYGRYDGADICPHATITVKFVKS